MASGSTLDRYLAGQARAFFPSDHRDREDRGRALKRALRPLAPEVASALEAQNATYAPSSARDANLAALRAGAAAVVTGQQVGLLLGPLYTVYKAASAIALARALSAESGRPVVPVFWLQTEDHDLAEVASCHALRADGELLRMSMPVPLPESRVSLAHVPLPEPIGACLASLRIELGDSHAAREHCAELERHYRAGVSYARAFAGLLAELFAPEGLVLIDPRTPELAAAAAPVHRRALREAAPIAQALNARCRELVAAELPAPVHVRLGSPLSFYHPLGAQGPRHRLAAHADGFAEVGGHGTHGLAQLLQLLASDPLRFSTSALLRPILQDVLLPTVAYVGGPGEIAYYAQLSPLYAAYEMSMPLVVPRARFVVIEPRAERLLRRHGLSPSDAQLGADVLLERCRPKHGDEPSAGELETRLRTAIGREFDAVAGALPALGAELDGAAAKTRTALDKAVRRFSQRYQSALLRRSGAISADVKRLKLLLHPLDQPQERVFCLPYFAARFGARSFVERVLDAVDPFDPGLRELRP